jgi:L-alanine-DL-glutamate epimerase-like enolase superfamily enzyme
VFLDAQGAWSLSEATDRIERFAPLGIDGVETPVGHPDPMVEAPGYYYDVPLLPDDIAELRDRVNVPIMEHVLDPSFRVELVRKNAVNVLTVEVCAVGVTATRRVLQLAESAGLDARVGSTLEFGPATQAGASLAAASPAITYPSDLIGPLVCDETVLERPVEYKEGTVTSRDEPGFGISVSEGTIQRGTTRMDGEEKGLSGERARRPEVQGREGSDSVASRGAPDASVRLFPYL